MLPVKLWVIILTYLPPIALFNISVCSKMFHVLAHKNKKFDKEFKHSKLIVSNVDMFDKYIVVWMPFAYQLYDRLIKNLMKTLC